MRAPCPVQKIINARSDCDLTRKRELFKTKDATVFFREGLRRILPAPKALAPLSFIQIATVMTSGNRVAQAPQNDLQVEEKKRNDLEAFIAKFGEDADSRKQLDLISSRIIEIKARMVQNEELDRTMVEFTRLVQSFLSLIQDPKGWTDLLESKNRDQLVGVFAQAMEVRGVPSTCTPGDYGDIEVGTIVKIKSTGYNNSGKTGTVTRLSGEYQGCPYVQIDDLEVIYVKDLEILN